MSYIPIIKEGIHAANRNWQLILILFSSMFLGFFSWLFIVGIPLAIAFVIFGVDLTEMLRQPDLISIFRMAGEMLSKSLPIVVFVVLSFVIYAAFLIAMSVFVVSGTIGILAKSIQNGQLFSLKLFWSEAKRLFFPVLIYANIAGLGFTFFTMTMGVLSEIVNQMVLFLDAAWPVIGAFINVFFGLVLGATGIFAFLVLMGISLYGFGYLAYFRPRPFKCLKQMVIYMYKTPSSMLMLFIVMGCFFIVLFTISMISIFSASMPLLALPFNFISQAALWYAIIVMVATLFLFYYRTGYQASLPATRPDQDTSRTQNVQPDPTPPAKEENTTV
jgi:hypothetical protein